ncbi:MAG TPA: right-handed parallel beta-helix repeat-containing protein [Bacillota bacterium]|nr:right-handed parallel beta-helix repeat-containing protein [Bacillota bacterium]
MHTLKTILFGGWLLGLFCLATPGAQFYVDSRAGDDTNAGISRRKPWRSLEKVNAAAFAPGDRVLFRAGSCWSSPLVVTAKGIADRPVTFAAYGNGPRPRIDGAGRFEDTVIISNAQHVVVRGFELTNKGAVGSGTNTPPRRGVHIIAENVGTLTNIVVSDLFIHDVNGTQKIKDNGGIIFTTRGARVPSRFEGLRIERNIIWRVDRSGIVAQSYHARRDRWFPSLNVIIRDNWLGDLGGDGITPWATDGCLVDHNIVQGANERAGTYNAGIWPWSTDNTVMRLNRASGVKTLLDGQGFDSDFNSRNTLLEYNLSHDNQGGFLLICTPGGRKSAENCGNLRTVVRYNISRHDQARTIHLAGAPEATRVYENAVYIAPQADVQLLLLSDWSGWANGLELRNNLFHSEGVARYGHQVTRDYVTGAYGIGPGWGPATNILFSGNAFSGRHEERPADNGNDCSAAPKPIAFEDWPGPQFDPAHPEQFSRYLQAHRQWMLRLMERQFGPRPVL